MEEEEEDQILLRNLGVESANPEDIERDILAVRGKLDFFYLCLPPLTILCKPNSAFQFMI